MIKPISISTFTRRFSRELAQAVHLESLTAKPKYSTYIQQAQQMYTGQEIPFQELDNVFVIAYFNTLRKFNPEACVAWLNKIAKQIKGK